MSDPRPIIEVEKIEIAGGLNIFITFKTLHQLLEYSKGYEKGDIFKVGNEYYLMDGDVAYYVKEE